jgi:hypothetical protein
MILKSKIDRFSSVPRPQYPLRHLDDFPPLSEQCPGLEGCFPQANHSQRFTEA